MISVESLSSLDISTSFERGDPWGERIRCSMGVLVVVNTSFNIPTEIKVEAFTCVTDLPHPDPLH